MSEVSESQRILRTRAINDINLCIEKLAIHRLALKTCKDEHKDLWKRSILDLETMQKELTKALEQFDDSLK